VVLTGGACQLPGTRELASTVLDKQVRIGRPTHVSGLAEATAGPAYAACAGLLNYAVTAEVAVPGEPAPAAREAGGLVGRLGHWLREHF
jgi:cell division protein FtsA